MTKEEFEQEFSEQLYNFIDAFKKENPEIQMDYDEIYHDFDYQFSVEDYFRTAYNKWHKDHPDTPEFQFRNVKEVNHTDAHSVKWKDII